MKAAPLKATITLREDLTPSLARFEFALEGGVSDFKPGQFLTIGLPHPEKEGKTLWRPYSISSKPEQKECMELYIRLAERPVPGLFTTMLWKLGVGDVMDYKDPKGAFIVNHTEPDDSPETRRLVMIGGGTGVAPFVSMIGSLKDAGCNREIILCQGASYQQELGYRDYFEGLAAESEANGHKDWNFHYMPSISRPDEEANAGWTGHTGRVETLIVPGEDGLNAAERVAGEHFTPKNASFYICGFGAIVDSICDTVKDRGFVARKEAREDGSYDIRFESYG